MNAKEKLNDLLLDLAWRQWTELGVSGVNSYGALAIDLEQLLIFTGTLSDTDPRLHDEALDWCAQYGRFVSKPRLKTLISGASSPTQRAFSKFAGIYNALTKSSWPGADEAQATEIRLSGKSRSPDLTRPALFNLRMRSLFGVGARADVLTALLGSTAPNWSAPDLTYVGYTRRNIAQVLEELAASGTLRGRRVRNQLRFEWVRREELAALVEPLPIRFPRWPELLGFLTDVRQLVCRTPKLSPLVAGIEARKLLGSAEKNLTVLGLEPPTSTNQPAEDWSRFKDWALGLAEEVVRGDWG